MFQLSKLAFNNCFDYMTFPVIKLVVAYSSNYDVILWNLGLDKMINIEVNVVTMVFGQIYAMSCGK
jgi:hypothetical protein